MGSAAQPRSGTAPNAPAARAVLTMNSRRLCRFDRAPLAVLPAESLRAFVMPFPPHCCRGIRWLFVSGPVWRAAFFWMVTVFNIVYNTEHNFTVGLCGAAADGSSPTGDMMAGKSTKRETVRAPKSRELPVARPREPAAALIAKRIEEDIVLGRRQPRERLIEQDLCELFQTHRGDVRLALFELEKKGLVGRIPNRGALVRGLTPRKCAKSTRYGKSWKSWQSASFPCPWRPPTSS